MKKNEVEAYQPLGTLKSVAENIWVVDGPVINMALYGTTIPFPTRMTVIRLADGTLWCHSPVKLTDRLRGEIDALGPVGHLVSPNKIHYAFISQWQQAYPDATAWASPGVRERAAARGNSIRFDADLDDTVPQVWRAEIDQLVFRGSRYMEEVVFFHGRSKTLIVADLIENFEKSKVSARMRWLLGLTGVMHPDGKLPLDLRLTFLGRKRVARACLQAMLAWQPERIILSHGRCFMNDGSAELKRAFRWLE